MELLQLGQWTGILAVSLYVLIRGADLFVEGAKRIGASFGMSSFAIGVLIVGLGTSLPELASSIAAVIAGTTEIVIANAVGSNITNILLIVGLLAMIGGPVMINRNLLKTELPIFFIATIHFVASLYDGRIDQIESLLLFGTFCAYMWYLFSSGNEAKEEMKVHVKRKVTTKDIVFVVMGIVAVLAGAHYTVEMAVNIATGLAVPIGLVSIGAIAIGTSLPELFVSLQALKGGETDLAIGNIFGSNAFNILMVVGVPGLITSLFDDVPGMFNSAGLMADPVVMELGIWILVASSLILFINGLARQVQRWEGVAMLIFFSFFLVKLIAFV
ncbi:calcium/sodium antiporter [Candidatus Kaiserbacteria bacterium]|nr:calcium/sodium antiporter [Candidatus Kaiserbacteria bacterium]